MRETAGKGNLINGQWVKAKGATLASVNPANPDEVLWRQDVSPDAVDGAVHSARKAFNTWKRTAVDDRAALLLKLKDAIGKKADALALGISQEAGKPLWEARTEVAALRGKIDISLAEGRADIAPQVLPDGSYVRHQPHGVMAVLGPFNFPLSLSNGHIIPTLLAGNTVVLKPSEQTPAIAEAYAELFAEAGFPPGVFNLVQGAGDVGQRLAVHPDVSGILFTGSYAVGRALTLATIDQPYKILTLEMGGKNGCVVFADAPRALAMYEVLFSAFVTAGQRCTATSRLILVDDDKGFAAGFIKELVSKARELVMGDPTSPATFMGPLVSARAHTGFLHASKLLAAAGEELLGTQGLANSTGYFASPQIVRAKFTGHEGEKFYREEVFGPTLTVFVAKDADEAMRIANDTEYGLALSVFTADRAQFEACHEASRVGILNWNKGTVGATGKLPFGGIGKSGNFRPAGVYSGRYATYPVATVIGTELPKPDAIPPGFAKF